MSNATLSDATLSNAPARPAPGIPRAYAFPTFQTRILSNGLRLIVAPIHNYPVVTVLAVIEAGATRDPVGCEGLAQLATRALAEGTATMDALHCFHQRHVACAATEWQRTLWERFWRLSLYRQRSNYPSRL